MTALERYLDDMFNLLAGTGAAGRRALAETEDHLRAATADAIARGLPAGQAEHEAVIRFGSPRRIARQLRRANQGRPLTAALSSAWLLAGVALAGLGTCYLAAALRTIVAQWGRSDCRIVLARDCAHGFGATRHVASTGTVILALGAVLLLGRWVLTRRARLAAGTRYSAAWSAAGCALAGTASYAAAAPPGISERLAVWRLAGLGTPLIATGVVVTASAAAFAWTMARSRQPRRLR
jgi:hypothetical protein